MTSTWERKFELPLYSWTPWVAEWYNTTSNLLFIVFGVSKCWEMTRLLRQMAKRDAAKDNPKQPGGLNNPDRLENFIRVMIRLWVLMIVSGACSAFHHATDPYTMKWTIIIDWIPILSTIVYIIFYHPYLVKCISMTTCVAIGFSLAFLGVDHVYTPVPVPWGHVTWHLLAACSISMAYNDMFYSYVLHRVARGNLVNVFVEL
jgi:hypothetical protein